MFNYILRRLAYALPILLGVNFITFALFFMVITPDDMARLHLGDKHITQEQTKQWKHERGYDRPLFINSAHQDIEVIKDTIFYQKSVRLFFLDFGTSDADRRDINYDISQRVWPSIAIAVPTFVVGLLVNITMAMLLVFFRGTQLDTMAVVMTVILMSISSLFYIIAGQFLMSKLWHLTPISGYELGFDAWRFLILPVVIGVISGMGAGTRWYRSIFFEEINRDYVRTARAKGVPELKVLFRHVLRNAMVPILTGVVVVIPALFMGSLIMETFFAIPGLGSYTIEAIQSYDFAIVRSMVFLGSVLYIIGLVLTDISYTWVDPRVRLS
ncbi:MAG: ABC transporter permease [Candidatus Parabeggiatoa sp. nov. 1]|nr:MAG: ABC transporter permease [Gammaproteobacteria bacterium]